MALALRKAVPSASRVDTAQQVLSWVTQGRAWWQQHTRWSVSISSTDRLYDVAHRWFTDAADSEPPRALSARLTYGGDRHDAPVSSGRDRAAAHIDLYYDVRRDRTVEIDGHQVTVSLNRTEVPSSSSDDIGSFVKSLQPDVLHFHARSRDGQQAVIAMLRNLAASQDKRRPALHLLNSWGSWSRRDDLPARTLDSVVLAAGQMERICGDVQRFLDAESDYVERGLPWHRGYLFHGPAGTGKTSAVRALAAHFGLDLWYAPLGDLSKDTSLLSLISEVGPRSILLLEDVDVFHAARQRDDQGDGVSMAGLLNALDGVATPHGMITILTTNDVDVIDAALLRPGRVDLREPMDLPTAEQTARLWAQFYRQPLDQVDPDLIRAHASTAALMGLFQHHLHDPRMALAALYLPLRDPAGTR